MFTSLDQVVSRWTNRYEMRPIRQEYLPAAGYSEENLAEVESYLKLRFEPKFRDVLMSINIDTINFLGACFGCGRSYFEFLRRANQSLAERENTDDDLSIEIGGTSAYIFVLNNSTGHIAALNEYEPEYYEVIAEDFESLLCRLAYITDNSPATAKDKFEAIVKSRRLVEQIGISPESRFWVTFARHAS
jgi:hypothetical protein